MRPDGLPDHAGNAASSFLHQSTPSFMAAQLLLKNRGGSSRYKDERDGQRLARASRARLATNRPGTSELSSRVGLKPKPPETGSTRVKARLKTTERVWTHSRTPKSSYKIRTRARFPHDTTNMPPLGVSCSTESSNPVKMTRAQAACPARVSLLANRVPSYSWSCPAQEGNDVSWLVPRVPPCRRACPARPLLHRVLAHLLATSGVVRRVPHDRTSCPAQECPGRLSSSSLLSARGRPLRSRTPVSRIQARTRPRPWRSCCAPAWPPPAYSCLRTVPLELPAPAQGVVCCPSRLD